MFAGFAVAYAVLTPVGSSPDELSHLNYARLIADHAQLPPETVREHQQPPAGLGQEHKAINVSGNKNLPFSDGIVAGNTLYVAGQEGTEIRSCNGQSGRNA